MVNPYAENLTYEYAAAPQDLIDRAREIDRICQLHHVPMTAAALQYPLSHPAVSCVLSGCRSGKEVNEVLDWMGMEIVDGLWEDLRGEWVAT